MNEDRNAELLEGEFSAGSILDRANEALGKEYRLAAMTELQSRVEDWKGHKMDHFGELLLHGSFTVLKGEGAKEVEREVRNSFDTQNPKCRSIMCRGCRRALSLHISHPRASEQITTPEITPMASPSSSEVKKTRSRVRSKKVPEGLMKSFWLRGLLVHLASIFGPISRLEL